ncbi:MAG: hypothetical protein SOZ28_08460 [Clostridia bacterium]|nr:hypothetical protein [Clostridia bacterium]
MKQVCNIIELFQDENLTYIKQHTSDTPFEGKERIVKHLRNGKVLACAAGRAKDVLTGESIKGELTFMTDGEFEWRSDIAYYVDKYNLRLSNEFENYVLS